MNEKSAVERKQSQRLRMDDRARAAATARSSSNRKPAQGWGVGKEKMMPRFSGSKNQRGKKVLIRKRHLSSASPQPVQISTIHGTTKNELF